MQIPYCKQQTPFTCALACLRMVFGYFDRETTEVELARVVGFSPEVGISMPDLAKACEIMNFEYKLLKYAGIEDIKEFVSKNFYPIVILKTKIYEKILGEYGHFVIIKNITDKSVIVNGPDQEFGGEDKTVDINIFKEAWNASKNWLLVVKGEII